MLGTWKRVGHALVPADDDATEALASLKAEQEVVINVNASRNPAHHALFFGLLKLLVDNTDMFETVDQALVAVKVATHEVDTWIEPSTGEVFYIPRSIAFQSMDQARFRRLFDRAVFVICEKWMQGTNADELRKEAYKLVDGEQRSSLGERAA